MHPISQSPGSEQTAAAQLTIFDKRGNLRESTTKRMETYFECTFLESCEYLFDLCFAMPIRN